MPSLLITTLKFCRSQTIIRNVFDPSAHLYRLVPLLLVHPHLHQVLQAPVMLQKLVRIHKLFSKERVEIRTACLIIIFPLFTQMKVTLISATMILP
ncbi:hypothetical protein HW555_012082 [Spodoptera exigua]|uniref:Uncharacterized protein n=1 Tax=Spodoptera exigua TaxID=7107 RepID=A0A835G7A1_SPOEX|nr:hypothetical protein HW555_012082 [Spodoptera exigua]